MIGDGFFASIGGTVGYEITRPAMIGGVWKTGRSAWPATSSSAACARATPRATASMNCSRSIRTGYVQRSLHLLPKQGRAVPAFEQFLQKFGSFEYLYVVFDAPEGHAVDDYQEQIDAFVARLKALPEIERVDAGLFGDGKDWRYLADRVLLVLSPERAHEALGRFGAGQLPGQVAGARELLGVPSPEVAAMVASQRNDLLVWMRAAQSSLDRMAAIAIGDASWVLARAGERPRGEAPATVEGGARASRLLSFMLSPAFFSMRERLGMGVK